MDRMIEEAKGLRISDTTARLIACKRLTDEVYGGITQSLCEMYGEGKGEEIMAQRYNALFAEFNSAFRELIADSISNNLDWTDPSEI